MGYLLHRLRDSSARHDKEADLLCKAAANSIEALQAELLEQCRLNGMGSEREARLMARVEELENELAECRKDAERYRFLRKGTHDFPAVYLQSGSDDYGWFPSDGTDIDVAIDAAIGESK